MTAGSLPPRPQPISLSPPDERYAHVARRLNERGGILWDPVRVAALEKKIKFVRQQTNLGKPVAPILPRMIGTDKDGHTQYWRVLVAGEAHTFVWSQICRGLISYRGRGELAEPHVVPTSAKP